MGLKQEFNFREYLTKNIDGYDGKYAQYILMLPALYDSQTYHSRCGLMSI